MKFAIPLYRENVYKWPVSCLKDGIGVEDLNIGFHYFVPVLVLKQLRFNMGCSIESINYRDK